MSAAHDREHPAADGGPLRPGGGTYPVRAAVTARHPPPPLPKQAPAPRPVLAHPPRRGSPRVLVTVILLALALFTFVLLALSLSGYIPDADAPPAPAADAPADPGATAPDP
jgi:hypothetical protein